MQSLIPLSALPLFDSCDPKEVQEQLMADLEPPNLPVRDWAPAVDAAANSTRIANSSITYLQYDVSIESRGVAERRYVFLAMLEGHMRLRVHGDELDLTTGEGAVIVPDSPFRLAPVGRASALMWEVSRSALEGQAAVLTGYPLFDAVRFEPHVRLNAGKGLSLFRALRFVAGELQDDSGIAQSRAVQENLEQMLIRALLDTQPSQITEALERRRSRVAPRCVQRVERYIAEHLAEEITLTAIMEAAGVSSRTLFSAFKKFFGMSPMAYLRQVRMQKVRRDLLNAEPGTHVTDILRKRGVTQFGRFAVAYKRIYGESPSKTIKS
jgi:AraC-like DNA-binding protein